jgi:serine/threonine protein kinase
LNKQNEIFPVDSELPPSLSASKKKPDNPYTQQNHFPFNFVLSDYGMAVKINLDGQPTQIAVGDQAFMPLESFEFERLKSNNLELQKIDIFSIGLILYLMMFGRPVPLTGQEWEQHRDPTILRQRLSPLHYSERLKELVLSCLSVKPSERPTADQLQSVCCLIRRESDAIDQCNNRRQITTLSRRIKEFQSASQSPTTSSQKIPFSSSKFFQDADGSNQHEQRESLPNPISSDSDKDQKEAATHF